MKAEAPGLAHNGSLWCHQASRPGKAPTWPAAAPFTGSLACPASSPWVGGPHSPGPAREKLLLASQLWLDSSRCV